MVTINLLIITHLKSLEIGIDFYKSYGQESGFDVNFSCQKKYNDRIVRLRYSTCSSSDVKRRKTSSKKKRCHVSKFKNIYVFVEDHNHELVAQD
uniref:FAR1 domain-containing protein n=1 Tax=Lactuca sativa TaxID=4236 RepID=A0A9R1VAD5_LACSA|nr:hypothetical protein LSAT_V11C600305110 [Lactuca sativa]